MAEGSKECSKKFVRIPYRKHGDGQKERRGWGQ